MAEEQTWSHESGWDIWRDETGRVVIGSPNHDAIHLSEEEWQQVIATVAQSGTSGKEGE